MMLQPILTLAAIFWLFVFMYVVWDNVEAIFGDNKVPASQQALLWWIGTMCVGCFGASKVLGFVGSVKGKGGKKAMKHFLKQAKSSKGGKSALKKFLETS
jgi:hypothetical protein